MISFTPTEDQQTIAAAIERVVVDVLRPAARDLDMQGEIQSGTLDALWATGLVTLAFDQEPLPEARTTGWMALEAIATADAALAVALATPLGYAQAVASYGTEAQRQTLRAAWSVDSYRCAAVLVQEPRFGFDPTDLHTTARQSISGYRLNGRKSCVPLAGRCTDFLVVASTEAGLRAFLVSADAPGVSISKPDGSLGLKSLGLTDVVFHDVALPAEALLGEGSGCDAGVLIDAARIASAAIMTGIARTVLDHLVPYLKDRVAHGTPLARKQSVAFRLADMAIESPAMRWMGWRAAAALEKGRDVRREARQAQLYCAEQARWITDEGVQLMGGHGYMRENPVERWFRDARTLAAMEGTVGL